MPQAIGNVLVAAPDGTQIPLGQLARIEHTRGPAMLASENGLLLATVLLNVQGRDVGGFVEDAKAAVGREVALPAGYYVAWSGRWENQERARQRLQVVVPIVLVVIFALLYWTYGSAIEAAHVLLAVPFALTGGLYLLWALGYNFSVAVWVGFIALFGTAVQTGVVMVIYLEEAVERRRQSAGGRLTREALKDAVIEGALLRLRPKVMTVVHGGGGTAADHVEHECRRRSHEAAGHAGAGRHGVVAAARAGGDAGDLLLDSRAPIDAHGKGDAMRRVDSTRLSGNGGDRGGIVAAACGGARDAGLKEVQRVRSGDLDDRPALRRTGR